MNQTWTYSNARMRLVFGVLDLTPDLEPGSGVTVTPDRPIWRTIEGVDGQFVMARDSRFSATVSASISVHSETHARLIQAVSVDAVTGLGPRPLALVEPDTGVSYACPYARIEGPPAVDYTSAASYATWNFLCPIMAVSSLVGASTGITLPV